MRHGRETRFQHRLKRMQTLSGEAERVRESFSTTDRDRSDRNKQQQSNTRDKPPASTPHTSTCQSIKQLFTHLEVVSSQLVRVCFFFVVVFFRASLTLTSDVVRPKTFAVCVKPPKGCARSEARHPVLTTGRSPKFQCSPLAQAKKQNIATLTKLQRVYYQL